VIELVTKQLIGSRISSFSPHGGSYRVLVIVELLKKQFVCCRIMCHICMPPPISYHARDYTVFYIHEVYDDGVDTAAVRLLTEMNVQVRMSCLPVLAASNSNIHFFTWTCTL
jgi:hypothetical protein